MTPVNEKNLLGQRFGRLVVIQKLPKKNNRGMWLCKCDCGLIKMDIMIH